MWYSEWSEVGMNIFGNPTPSVWPPHWHASKKVFQPIAGTWLCQTAPLAPTVHFSIPARKMSQTAVAYRVWYFFLWDTPLCMAYWDWDHTQPLSEGHQKRGKLLWAPALAYVKNIIWFTKPKLGQTQGICQTKEWLGPMLFICGWTC